MRGYNVVVACFDSFDSEVSSCLDLAKSNTSQRWHRMMKFASIFFFGEDMYDNDLISGNSNVSRVFVAHHDSFVSASNLERYSIFLSRRK